MKSLARCLLASVGVAVIATTPAAAQRGELQLGGLVSYGTPRSFGRGAGIVAGIGVARLLYVGVRWDRQSGSRDRVAGSQAEIATHTSLLMADLGIMLPAGDLEIVPGMSLGSMRFAQSGSEPAHVSKLVLAPGVSLHAHIAWIVAIPELQYVWAGAPGLSRPVSHRGAVATLRLVFPIELRRIRY